MSKRMRPSLLTACIGFALRYEQFAHDEEQREAQQFEDGGPVPAGTHLRPGEVAAPITRLHIAEGDEDLFNSTVRVPAVQP